VTTVTASRQSTLPHGEAAVNYYGGSICACHDRCPSRDHLRFERCVSAEAAAVFAALLLFGSRKTLDAALAACLLVTSPLDPRFGIACSENSGLIHH
jgi:hypothetical protein